MATDRVELERDRGETFTVDCPHCLKKVNVHVNRVSARPNRIFTYGGILLGLGSIALFWGLGFIATLSAAIPILVHQAQRKAAHTFNAYMIRRS